MRETLSTPVGPISPRSASPSTGRGDPQAWRGGKFNVGSPKQLGEILFDEHGQLPGGKKRQDGRLRHRRRCAGRNSPPRVTTCRPACSTGASCPSSRAPIRTRCSTQINPETGRVHTSFSLAGGRPPPAGSSSNDPNLQNIPVRTEEGSEDPKGLCRREGPCACCRLDYSQIELRILAHIAQIDALKQAFRDGLDIHAMTASEVFGVPLDEMTPEIRRRAKAINFGVIYGISAFGLSHNLRIPREDAQAFITAYFEKFPGIRAYMDDTKAHAREKGYVETLFGRRIHTPGIQNKGPHRGFAERAAINAPIQGTAADVIRRAMIRIPAAMQAARLTGRMLLQVHDELLFEVPEGEADRTADVVREVMEGAASPAVELAVPLVVDAGTGESWAEAH